MWPGSGFSIEQSQGSVCATVINLDLDEKQGKPVPDPVAPGLRSAPDARPTALALTHIFLVSLHTDPHLNSEAWLSSLLDPERHYLSSMMTNMIFCRKRLARKLGSFSRMHWGAGGSQHGGGAHLPARPSHPAQAPGVTDQETLD